MCDGQSKKKIESKKKIKSKKKIERMMMMKVRQ